MVVPLKTHQDISRRGVALPGTYLKIVAYMLLEMYEMHCLCWLLCAFLVWLLSRHYLCAFTSELLFDVLCMVLCLQQREETRPS